MSDEAVQPGEDLLTSGGDQIFPKGLHVGTVTKVGSGKDLFLNIKIRPAADLSRLEEVLVLVEKQERQSTADDHVRIRAADILAQRLPSVPDRPAVDANGKSAASGSAGSSSIVSGSNKPASAGTNGISATKPAANAASGLKPATTTGTPQAGNKLTPGLSQHAAGTPPAPGAPVRTMKPKTATDASTQVKPPSIQLAPENSEQKPAPVVTTQPNTPPPAEDNSPQ
jgi:rod shape-determining protein MreC